MSSEIASNLLANHPDSELALSDGQLAAVVAAIPTTVPPPCPPESTREGLVNTRLMIVAARETHGKTLHLFLDWQTPGPDQFWGRGVAPLTVTEKCLRDGTLHYRTFEELKQAKYMDIETGEKTISVTFYNEEKITGWVWAEDWPYGSAAVSHAVPVEWPTPPVP